MTTGKLSAFDKKYGNLFNEQHVPSKQVEQICLRLINQHQDQVFGYIREIQEALLKESEKPKNTEKRTDQYLDALNAFMAFKNSRDALFHFFMIDAYVSDHKISFQKALDKFNRSYKYSDAIKAQIINLHNGPTEAYMKSGELVFEEYIDKFNLRDLIKYEDGSFTINV